MKETRRVVITGMGVVTGIGLNEDALWRHMLEGCSGIARIRAFDVSDYRTRNGAEVDNEALATAMEDRAITPLDRTVDMARVAAGVALEQAGLLTGRAPVPPLEVPTIFGTGIGATASLYRANEGFFRKGVRGVRPTSAPRGMANAISAQVSMQYRLTGPNYVIVSACTSATTAMGVGFRMIRDGYAEHVLCGGAESMFDPFTLAAWDNLGVMSKNPDAARACRPFDADRDGCILGEGAGAFVLESLSSAKERGVRVRAELAGFGESSDATHITSPDAEGQAKAIRAALESAGIMPHELGFINAHGTATIANDRCESESLRLALGTAATSIPVASNKSFFGHMLGASGAVESVVTVLGLEHGLVPPNLNLDKSDPACDLLYVGADAMEIDRPVAMKNSFGFGGSNAVLIFRGRP